MLDFKWFNDETDSECFPVNIVHYTSVTYLLIYLAQKRTLRKAQKFGSISYYRCLYTEGFLQ